MTDTTTQGSGEGTATPAPGTPEYDTAMAAKFRESQSTVGENLANAFGGKDEPTFGTVPDQQRPGGVPEKFWDAEKGAVRVDELLKSYTELESNKGKAAADPDTDPAAKTGDNAEAQAAVEAAGLKWDDLTTKVSTNGKIDDADYAALEKIGIPKTFVDRVIANEVALASFSKDAQDRATVDAMAYIGGQTDPAANSKATAELLDWAAKSLTPDQITGYNKMLSGSDWKVAVDTLKTMRTQALGKQNREPNLLNPKGQGVGSTVGYQSREEMQADMGNPLYSKLTPDGEVFRQQVAEKVRLAAWRR